MCMCVALVLMLASSPFVVHVLVLLIHSPGDDPYVTNAQSYLIQFLPSSVVDWQVISRIKL